MRTRTRALQPGRLQSSDVASATALVGAWGIYYIYIYMYIDSNNNNNDNNNKKTTTTTTNRNHDNAHSFSLEALEEKRAICTNISSMISL